MLQCVAHQVLSCETFLLQSLVTCCSVMHCVAVCGPPAKCALLYVALLPTTRSLVIVEQSARIASRRGNSTSLPSSGGSHQSNSNAIVSPINCAANNIPSHNMASVVKRKFLRDSMLSSLVWQIGSGGCQSLYLPLCARDSYRVSICLYLLETAIESLSASMCYRQL